MTVRLRLLQCKDCIGMSEWMYDMDIVRFFCDGMLTKTERVVLKFIDQADIVLSNGKGVQEKEYLKSIILKDKNTEYAIGLRRYKAEGRMTA